MQSIPRINIAYAPGSYGNYIKWILYSLLVDEPLVSPFKESTSHNMNYISDMSVNRKLFSRNMCDTVELLAKDKHLVTNTHPRLYIEDDTFNNAVEKIASLVDYVLVPYCDYNCLLLGIHNLFFKVFRNDKFYYWRSIDREELKKGWGVDYEQPLESVDRWILREHMSFNMVDHYNHYAKFDLREMYNISNCKLISINELFYKFLPTIESIRKFLKVEWIRNPQDLLDFHRTNINKQKYKNQDVILRQILNSVFDNTNFEWQSEDITLFTEAYIQRALQHQGIMLKCNGLNNFPTSTKALVEVFE